MIWGVDPWFLAALVLWGCLGPILGVILGWRIARERNNPALWPVHSPEPPTGMNGDSGPRPVPIWDRLTPRSWRP